MHYMRLLFVISFIVADTICNIGAPALALSAGEYVAQAFGWGILAEIFLSTLATILVSLIVLTILDFWLKFATDLDGVGHHMKPVIVGVIYIINTLWFFMSIYYLFQTDFPSKDMEINSQFTFLVTTMVFIVLKLIAHLDPV